MSEERRLRLDPWDVRHLLLSVEDRERDARDQADLDDVLRRIVSALEAAPAAPHYVVSSARGESSTLRAIPAWWFETNTWVFGPDGPGGQCVLVDVPPDPRSLLRYVERERLEVAAILLTHGHVDHAGGVGWLARALDRAPLIYVHTDDVPSVMNPEAAAGPLSRVAPMLIPPVFDHVLAVDDGDHIDAAGCSFSVLHTPGHTRGSCCFFTENGNRSLLFTGDQLFAGGGTGRCDLGGASRTQLAESTLRRIAPLADEVIVLPGHGGPTTIGAERVWWDDDAMPDFLVGDFG